MARPINKAQRAEEADSHSTTSRDSTKCRMGRPARDLPLTCFDHSHKSAADKAFAR